jgi:hypothetical protein
MSLEPDSPGESETGLEASSDGVLAVIITIVALELKAPGSGDFASLRARLPGAAGLHRGLTDPAEALTNSTSPASR